MIRTAACLTLAGLLLARAGEGGQATASVEGTAGASPSTASRDVPLTFDGPPAPVPPEVISRDASGRTTIRAVRLTQPIRIDGALDEAFYQDVPAISGFTQIEPEEGAPATEGTDLWLSFDNDNVYVSFRCWDSHMDSLIATEMRRDNGNIWRGNDVVTFVFDTFYDRRNAVQLIVNPISGRQDGQLTNERQYSGDWNPVWDSKAGRFVGGWTVEAAVPFKSLRYRPGLAQLWGFNAMRVKRSKNEITVLRPMPKARGQQALQQLSLAATVVGLEVPGGSRNLDIKPYLTSNMTTDVNARPRISNHLEADFGVDLKYGLTKSLTADLTYNTDFAHVEVDEQQVNLTRFSLFFPEKRDFFLENQGTFSFGGVSATGMMAGASDAPILFYSRRIGLNRGGPVPLDVGGRITGPLGKYNLGIVNIQTGDEPATSAPSTNFSVVRLRRDFLRRSSIGAILTRRSVAESGRGTNLAYGVDGTFSFYDNLNINTYWARTDTAGVSAEDTISYRAQLDYAGDRYGVQLERMAIGDNFNPEVGFMRRDNMLRHFGQFKFSPRPRANRSIRKFVYMGSVDHIANRGGRLETRKRIGEFAIEFQNTDRFSVTYTNEYEFVPLPFAISPTVTLPVGGYDFDNVEIALNMSQQRTLSFDLAAEYGTFYGGHKTTFTASRGRVNITPQISVEPTYTLNRVDLVQGSFTRHLGGSRITYTMTPLMFASAFLQYNSDTHSVSANVRFRWEYRPGSELFIVYNENRDTLAQSFPALNNRAIIVKVNRLLRF